MTTTTETKTVNVRFVGCGSQSDIEVRDVPIIDGDDVGDVLDRAAEMWCPAEDAKWEDLDDEDERKWSGEYDPADDNLGAGFFFRDNGISTADRWYGQIFRPVSKRQGNGNSSVTWRVFVDVEFIRDLLADGDDE